MNTTKTLLAAMATAFCASLASATPVVSNVTMAQDGFSRLVTIHYTLDSEAVVTLDVQTNYVDGAETKWVSIGGAALTSSRPGKTAGPAQGDVWKKVAAGTHTITWRPDISWPDHRVGAGGARAVVTAWALDNPPDYLVVELNAGMAGAGTERYYPAADFLPGGLLENEEYRKTKLVMRKITAAGITWTMSSNNGEAGSGFFVNNGDNGAHRETPHNATIADNYYIGVFEITQYQWWMVKGAWPSYFKNETCRAMRPVEQVSYNAARNSADNTANAAYNYPAAPNSGSYIGTLRTRTGIAFDLPSEAQWEFACRAGHGAGCWGDGTVIGSNQYEDANLDALGRYLRNGGKVPTASGHQNVTGNETAENGTAICGSYKPNDWGLYDMHGNVYEWCLDWFAIDITSLNGDVNTTQEGSKGRVFKGGSYEADAHRCRPSFRNQSLPQNAYNNFGIRLVCPVTVP